MVAWIWRELWRRQAKLEKKGQAGGLPTIDPKDVQVGGCCPSGVA